MELEELLELENGRCPVFPARIDLSQKQLREGEVSRIDSLDFLQMLQRFVEFAKLQVVQSQTRLPFRILGSQLYCLAISIEALFRLSLGDQRGAQADQSPIKAGIQVQGLAVICFRLLQPARLERDVSKRVPGCRKLGRYLHSLLQTGGRPFRISFS